MSASIPFWKTLRMRSVRSWAEFRAGRTLDGMDRPQNLHEPMQIYHLARSPVRMVGGEASMVSRMPILGGQDESETFHESVDHRDHFISIGDTQSSAWQKVVLDVHHKECVHMAAFQKDTESVRNSIFNFFLASLMH